MKKNTHTGFVYPLFLFALALAACGGNAPTPGTTNNGADTSAQTVPDPRPAVLLDGLYATSTAPGQDVYALFDNNPQTGWSTRDGAGPDEGIMLYFANPTIIRMLEVKPEPGTFRDPVLPVMIYLNGIPFVTEILEGKVSIDFEEPIRSFYLRFDNTGKESQENFEQEDKNIIVSKLPRDARIRIRELIFYNDKNEPMRIVPPERLNGIVSASSALKPEQAYKAANLFDARKEFAWVEGNEKSDGTGEELNFEFGQPVRITAVKVWNGYQRSEEHYKANARVRDFEFGLTRGPAQRFTLRDDPAGQKIDLPSPISGQMFSFKVASIFPGKKYKDLALSELVFFDGDKPFVVKSEQPEQLRQQLSAQTATSPLEAVLDRSIINRIDEPMMITEQSIILRSDGTFVMYSTWIDQTDAESEILADGNWELLEAGPRQATVKVFGKWNDLTNFASWYEGNKQTRDTRIFNDILTIDAKQLSGEKLIGTFYIQQ